MKKVSIITPCYNGEQYIRRYLNSILAQTHDNIELIIINDGSTDKTEELLLCYKDKVEKRGYSLKYLKQENLGQASAVNNGLKVFSGDYFSLIDVDDFIPPSSIQKKAEFLEMNPQFGLVRTDGYFYDEKDINKPLSLISYKNPNRFNEDIFKDLLLENTYVANGCYMYCTSAFLDVNPNREIYLSKGGQNWQVILPICHKYKCGFIDEPLFNCVVRNESHSRISNNNYYEVIKKEKLLKDILIHVIKDMDIDRNYYLKMVDIKYYRREMFIALRFKYKACAKDNYQKLKEENALNFQDKICRIFGINLLTKILMKLVNIIKKILVGNKNVKN